MLKSYLRNIFRRGFYPTRRSNWYKNKGYEGEDLQQQFADFLAKQLKPGSRFFEDFQSLTFTRQFIQSGAEQLDSVLIVPDMALSKDKAGSGVYIILFQGRGEYYEGRFRDAARQAKSTGASILVFNPKGFNNSSGHIRKLSDLVDDGIAVVDFLLKKNIDSKKIIFQGNSLGAGVQEMVSEYYKINHNIKFRQINSNSFKNLASVAANYYNAPFLEIFFSILLSYSGWEILPGKDFYRTGPYKMYLRRKGDRVIYGSAEFHYRVDHQQDYELCPDGYKAINKWLNERNQIIYTGKKTKDPHELGLSEFKINEEDRRSVFHMINIFIQESKNYI